MIVLIGSHKGGVGKSTKAANIAVAARYMSKKTIAMVGSDKLGCLKSWYARRQEAGLPSFTFVEAYGDLRKELTELNKHYDIVLVDTAGHRYPLLDGNPRKSRQERVQFGRRRTVPLDTIVRLLETDRCG